MPQPHDDGYYKKRDKELAEMLNNPDNYKFDKIWGKEVNIIDDLLQACNWYLSWSQKRDAFAAEGNEVARKNCEDMVEWWDERLVKVVGNMASLDKRLRESDSPLTQEFNKRSMSMLSDFRELLAELSDSDIKIGAAIFKALQPILTADAPPPPKQNPPGNGNPFKKGPSN
ncbi:MAG: hypothetical protein KGL10_05660 [Alphaproteobacteria bacterium]|nr:hypothetical protein [Alphaproteobacteria bacterium]MDE2336780.1 hypothetical protein [Alphaproteobacteria bacterium]